LPEAEKTVWSSNIIKMEQSNTGGVEVLCAPDIDKESGDSENLSSSNDEGGPQFTDVDEARKKAAEILQEAKNQADELLVQAEADAEKLRKAAQKEGRKDGLKEGREKALQELEDSLEKFTEWQKQLSRKYDDSLKQIEQQLSALLVDLVEKAVGKTFQERPDWVVEMMKDCLGELSEIGDVTLTICREDLQFILNMRDELESQLPPGGNLLLNSDDDLHSGEFQIRADEGAFEVTAEDISESLQRVLQENYGRRRTENNNDQLRQ